MSDLPLMSDPLLRSLLAAPAAPGYEDAVRAVLRDALEGIPLEQDTLGNLIARFGAGRPRALVCAHMDGVALLATGVDVDGAVRFRSLGGVDDAALVGRHVRLLTSGGEVPGVIGIAPPHLREGPGAVAGWRTLAIDVGARSREEVAALGVRPPQPVVFAAESFAMTGHLVGRGADDRVCCYLLVRLSRRLRAAPPPATVAVAWTAQNEIGMRGAQALAARERRDLAVHLAAFGTTEGPWPPTASAYARAGAGPVLRIQAGRALASPEAVAWVKALAGEAGTPLQEGVTAGESETSVFQEQGSLGVSINLAVRYLHSDVEMVAWEDVELLERLLGLIIERLPDAPRPPCRRE